MEKDIRFGFHQEQHLLSPYLNSLCFPSDTGHPSPVVRNSHSAEDSTLRTVPFFPVSGLQQLRASELNDMHDWLYRMPHFHQAFAAVPNSASEEKSPVGPFDFRQQRDAATMGMAPAQKRFLVFDQSGGKTHLIYSSGLEAPVRLGACWTPYHPACHDCSNEEPRGSTCPLNPSTADENLEDSSRDVMENEMHEDTEELNALLCSDSDDDFSEDDEETSTGHSPSTMTDNGVQDLAEETGEEVDSVAGTAKRRKLLNGGYDMLSNRRTRSSVKTILSSALDDDAESSCGNGRKPCREESESWLGDKRSRKERICQTVSALQSIIPNANGKDAVAVIDEAICYLRSLKAQARTLGLDTI